MNIGGDDAEHANKKQKTDFGCEVAEPANKKQKTERIGTLWGGEKGCAVAE